MKLTNAPMAPASKSANRFHQSGCGPSRHVVGRQACMCWCHFETSHSGVGTMGICPMSQVVHLP